ncbi:ribosome biogenesis factor YjgA [Hylemonella sp. W303a]|uniref:ribosome biogenesis factor YjgA n=1 Tax=Hylemonella sp. W303a TaxID=3389873 RepID=UPI00396AFC5A
MSRKPTKGYYVKGQFVAEGSELDLELKRELKGDVDVSRTDLKRESTELQKLGEALLTLRADLLSRLGLPDKLLDALNELQRITNFEGRRRQSQFVGKLMRQLPPETLEAARAALAEQHLPSAQETALLHTAEQWREQLIADDTALARWMSDFPATDSQQLRALVRQARKDAVPADQAAISQGKAPRQGRAYRELFQLLRAQLAGAVDETDPAMDEVRDDE